MEVVPGFLRADVWHQTTTDYLVACSVSVDFIFSGVHQGVLFYLGFLQCAAEDLSHTALV